MKVTLYYWSTVTDEDSNVTKLSVDKKLVS